MEEHLGNLMKKIKAEIKIFEQIYHEIVTSYVYEYPYDMPDKERYNSALVNTIILEILNFSEKLIDLHVYTIHSIVNNIIEYYTPLDEINQYNPKDYDKRKICIV